MAEKRTLTEADLVTLVNSEFDNAQGVDGGDVSSERALAMDYYLQKLFGDETDDDISTVVSSDVADVVDGIMPSLMRLFMAGDNLVEFEPFDARDVEAAAQETDSVHYVFFKKNPAFILLFYWFFDALLQKNGYVKAWFDEAEEQGPEDYKGLNLIDLDRLVDDEELELLDIEERIQKDVVPVVTPEGPDFQIEESRVFDAKFRRIRKRGQVKVANVPPEQLRISGDAGSVDPGSGRFVGQECVKTRQELIGLGFDEKKVMALAAAGDQEESSEKLSRDDKSDDDDDASVGDPLMEKVLYREGYLRIDYDGDGYAELRKVSLSGSTLLDQTEVSRQPFHCISPKPMPHKHFGRSVAEQVMDLQKINSTLWRQTLGNLYHRNNPGHALWEQGIGENTLDDLLTRKAGFVARFARPVEESWAPITVPFTAGESFQMLEYTDKLKRDRTGVSADSEGLSPEALKHIQQSVLANALDTSKLKIELIARVAAETGIKSLFLHIHELMQKHQDRPEVLRLRGTFVPVDPREWRRRYDMTVAIGIGIGSREQNLIHLEALWQKTLQIVDAGGFGSMVTPANVHALYAEFAKNAGFKDPSRFITKVDEVPDRGGGQQEALAAQLRLAQEQVTLERQKAEAKAAADRAEHERKMLDLARQARKDEGDLAAKMELIANQLTEMELKYGQNVPGSKV